VHAHRANVLNQNYVNCCAIVMRQGAHATSSILLLIVLDVKL